MTPIRKEPPVRCRGVNGATPGWPRQGAALASWIAAGVVLAALLVGSAAWAQSPTEAPSGLSLDARVEEFVKALTLYLARFVEVGAALVICVASLRGLWSYARNVARPGSDTVPKEEIRLSLGRSLALALEFELGADILKTAVAPTWNDIGQLAAIAVLRTALNYFLERELQQAQERGGVPGRTAASRQDPS